MTPFSFRIENTDPSCALQIEVLVNDQVVVAQHTVQSGETISGCLDPAVPKHNLTISMTGKLPQHTKLDEAGNFLVDPRLIISDFEVDQVPAQAALYRLATYEHDCNGSQPRAVHDFSGIMGCNGQVRLTIPMPTLVWLLENT